MIRLATTQDEPQIQAIIKTVYDEFGFGWDPEGYHADIYNIESHFPAPNAFWVYEQNGSIIGCVGLEIFPTHPGTVGEIVNHNHQPRIAGADCEIVRLYLAKEARGQKIGYQLTKKAIEYGQQQGCKYMEIWSDFALTQAHKLYQQMGAKIIGERICPPPDETPEYGMILDLR